MKIDKLPASKRVRLLWINAKPNLKIPVSWNFYRIRPGQKDIADLEVKQYFVFPCGIPWSFNMCMGYRPVWDFVTMNEYDYLSINLCWLNKKEQVHYILKILFNLQYNPIFKTILAKNILQLYSKSVCKCVLKVLRHEWF